MSTLAALRRQAGVEIRLTLRRFGEALNPLVFFAATVALFPMGLSPEPERMAGYAAGVLWVATLLAVLFAQARQFRAEAYNGVLEQLALSPQPLWLLLGAKLTVQWLVLVGPLLILAPACAYALNLPAQGIPTLLLGLALATPTMVMLGSVGAALTVHAHQGGALLTVLVLPMLGAGAHIRRPRHGFCGQRHLAGRGAAVAGHARGVERDAGSVCRGLFIKNQLGLVTNQWLKRKS